MSLHQQPLPHYLVLFACSGASQARTPIVYGGDFSVSQAPLMFSTSVILVSGDFRPKELDSTSV